MKAAFFEKKKKHETKETLDTFSLDIIYSSKVGIIKNI